MIAKTTAISPAATHVSALVAFAPNGGRPADAFEWLLVEAEADLFSITEAARRKALAFMSPEAARTSTLFVTEVTQQWGADGIALAL